MFTKCKKETEVDWTVSTRNPRKRAADYLGTSEKTVQRVMKEYKRCGTVQQPHKGNTTVRESGLPEDVGEVIRRFVLQRAEGKELTSAVDVTNFINHKWPDLQIGERRVRRLLKRLGFLHCRVPAKGVNYKESAATVEKRHRYLQQLSNIRRDPHRTLVYTDESYCHHQHNRSFGWMLPNRGILRRHKGPRWIIIDAITKEGCVPGARLLYKFTGVGDYHGAVTHELYMRWFRQQLLPNLPPRSVIVMDNAKYHLNLPSGAPKLPMQKQQLQQILRDHGVPFESSDLLSSLQHKFRTVVKPTLKTEVEQVAEEHGHTVLFQPPSHSELQPIEKVWAVVKNCVARLYRDGVSMDDVRRHLDEGFGKITATTCKKIIEQVQKLEEQYRQLAQKLYDEEQENSVSSDEDSSGESGTDVDSEEPTE